MSGEVACTEGVPGSLPGSKGKYSRSHDVIALFFPVGHVVAGWVGMHTPPGPTGPTREELQRCCCTRGSGSAGGHQFASGAAALL